MLSRIISFFRSAEDRERLLRCMAGLVMCGIGFGALIRADLGLDPWDVFHAGVADRIGLPIGTVSVLVGFVVLLGWIPLRQRPALGTVLNALTIGIVMNLVTDRIPEPANLAAAWLMLAVAVLVTGAGIGLYIGAGLGPGPRDGLMTGIALRRGSIRSVRTGIELSALAAGWALGGKVGPGTVAFAVTIGPVAHVALERLAIPPRSSRAVNRAVSRAGETRLADPAG